MDGKDHFVLVSLPFITSIEEFFSFIGDFRNAFWISPATISRLRAAVKKPIWTVSLFTTLQYVIYVLGNPQCNSFKTNKLSMLNYEGN